MWKRLFKKRTSYAYAFESEMGWDEMLEKLYWTNPFRWQQRDTPRWGVHLTARALGKPHAGDIQIICEGGKRFVNVELTSESKNAKGVTFLFDSIRDAILLEILPAIGAEEIQLTEHIDEKKRNT